VVKILEGRNRATPSEAASFVEEFDRFEQERERKLAEIDAEFKKQKRALNKEINSEQKSLCEDAKKVGVKKGIIRAIAGGQKRIRKFTEQLEEAKDSASGSIDELEADDAEFAVDILTALGSDFAGFGLGAAAVAREGDDEKPANGGKDPIAAAAEAAWQDAAPKAKKAKAKPTVITGTDVKH